MTSLYKRIGGQKPIDAMVEIFYKKVLADDRIRHFFDDVKMKDQKRKMKMYLGYAFGGPVTYTGKDMRSAHKHLDITQEHFIAIAEHLQSSLRDLHVPSNIIAEVMQIVATVRNDIMGVKKAA